MMAKKEKKELRCFFSCGDESERRKKILNGLAPELLTNFVAVYKNSVKT